MSSPGRQHSKVLYRWGTRRLGKKVNHRKVEMKKKWWVLAQPNYSRVERRGEPREPVSSEVGSTSKTTVAFETHSRTTRITRARTL